MKCLLITNYFPPTIGGSSKVYGNLYKYGKNNLSILTTKYDHNTGDIISRDKKNDSNLYFVNKLQAPSVYCRNIFHSLLTLLKFDIPIQASVLLKTLSLLRQKKFDIICIGDLQMQGWLTFFLKFSTQTKVILFIHGEELSTKTSSRFFGKNAKLYLNKSDGIIAVSKFTKNMIISNFGIAESKVQLISNGIDLAEYRPDSHPNEIIQKYIKPDTTLIFGIGRLIERKGFDKAIEAISIVKGKGHNIHYVIAGLGEMRDTLNNKIQELNLQSTVTLIGKLTHSELTAFYQYCDIFLMPNRELENGDTEGFGLVFLEANAFKKPVIGGNFGGAVDAIIHKKTGLLVNSNSADEIANAVLSLANDPKLRNELGENGYEWVKQNDVKNKASEFLTYCNAIAKSSDLL